MKLEQHQLGFWVIDLDRFSDEILKDYYQVRKMNPNHDDPRFYAWELLKKRYSFTEECDKRQSVVELRDLELKDGLDFYQLYTDGKFFRKGEDEIIP